LNKNQSSADEADTGDDPSRDTRGIKYHAAIGENIHETVLGDEQKEGRGRSNYRVSAEARAFVPNLAFKPDWRQIAGRQHPTR